MKKLLILGLIMLIHGFAIAQLKKNGTPDMRYKANKQAYGNTYSQPNTNNTHRYQNGYTNQNGTYVEGHYKTRSNKTNTDNFSTDFNTNPYNGKKGYRAIDRSQKANNYGQGQDIKVGKNGGQYYQNSNGNKVYVPKR